jgi:hypothetical protein
MTIEETGSGFRSGNRLLNLLANILSHSQHFRFLAEIPGLYKIYVLLTG